MKGTPSQRDERFNVPLLAEDELGRIFDRETKRMLILGAGFSPAIAERLEYFSEPMFDKLYDEPRPRRSRSRLCPQTEAPGISLRLFLNISCAAGNGNTMAIRFDTITMDDQNLPVVSWEEDRNIFAPEGIGPARVACFIRPDKESGRVDVRGRRFGASWRLRRGAAMGAASFV